MAKIQHNKKIVFQEVFWTAVAVILVFLPKALLPSKGEDLIIVMNIVLSAQGKDRCPDVAHAGPFITMKARSRLDCARMCASREGCLHHAFHKNNGSCYHYYSTPAKLVHAEDCNFMVNSKSYEGCMPEAMKRVDPDGCSLPFLYGNTQYYQCLAATPNSTPQCATSDGQLADCIVPTGFYAQKNVENLPVGTTDPLPCVSNWIILMQQLKGSVNFTRNWMEYRNGFGDLQGPDFWIGNENMYAIANKPGMAYMLRVEVQTHTSQKWYYADYQSFSIDSEEKWYALHVSGYSGDAGDSLSNTSLGSSLQQNGMNFSSYDSDNDKKSTGSCAKSYSASWWFGSCIYSCLTCVYGSSTFVWPSLDTYGLENMGRLTAARMMSRSV